MPSEKEILYKRVDSLRESFCIDSHETIDSVDLITGNCRIDIEYHQFKTPNLCGITMIGEKVDTIILNSKRTANEKNFDCSHELMHLYLHRKASNNFNCFSRCQPQQNSYLEWQANEGAAQFLVPYQDFIPRFSALIDNPPQKDFWFIGYLAEYYGVSAQVISLRIRNLGYEIDQYRQGVDIYGIDILSTAQQAKRGIRPTCYEAICDFPLEWNSRIG